MTATPTRIYLVADTKSNRKTLVEAANPAQAIRHVAQATFTVEVPSTKDALDLAASGVQLQKAGAEPQGSLDL